VGLLVKRDEALSREGAKEAKDSNQQRKGIAERQGKWTRISREGREVDDLSSPVTGIVILQRVVRSSMPKSVAQLW